MLLDLKNNSIFLACWRERTRPVQMICFFALIAAVIFLSYFSVTLYEKNFVNNMKSLFYIICFIQASILLIQGSLFVWNMGRREVVSGTLDFHRNAPEAAGKKVFGLVFGGAWFEWVVCVMLMIMALWVSIPARIPVAGLLLFQASLALSGVFYHTVAAIGSLQGSAKSQKTPLVAVFLLLWIVVPFIFVLSEMTPFFSYALGLNAFKYIFPDYLPDLHIGFFTFTLPSLALQALIQIPMLMLCVRGLRRIFCLPNSPVWSKKDVVRFAMFILLVNTGFFIERLMEWSGAQWVAGSTMAYKTPESAILFFLSSHVSLFLILLFALGIVICLVAAPTYFKFSKYVVLQKRQASSRIGMFDDGASALSMVMIYLVLSGIIFGFYAKALHVTVVQFLMSYVLVSAYVLAFSGFLEFFRVSAFRKKKIFFASILIGWYILLPWLSMLVVGFSSDRPAALAMVSPLFGIPVAVDTLVNPFRPEVWRMIGLTLASVLALLMWGLAIAQSHRSRKRIESLL